MKSDDIKRDLAALKTEITALVQDKLAKRGDSAERLRRSQELNARFTELKSGVDALSPSDRRALEQEVWRTQRDLIFLLAQTPPPDLAGEARQLDNEAMELAKDLFSGAGDKAVYQQKAQALRKRLAELLAREGNRTPDAQRALSDAKLDIDYVARGGEGLISTHLAQVLRGIQPSKKP